MESGVFVPCLDQFMQSALVTWVKTFVPDDRDMHFDYSVLLDGVFLNDIMSQIGASTTPQGELTKLNRTQNLSLLVQQIKTYYQDNLKQLIMTPLPNVLLLGKTPFCEQGLEEMKKLLLLLLGCAVQCEKKEDYIERIQTLDFDTKAAIAVLIQELTHCQENVLDLQWLEVGEVQPDELEVVARRMALHIRSLLHQRDINLETITELMQDWEGGCSLQNGPSCQPSVLYSPTMQQHNGAQQHLSVELADSKSKIRRLRQEIEEKSEQILDCRHELENMEAELKRIQQENSQLLIEARAARTYRDELDAMRERAIRADKLESEVGRYRDQLHKMEFYKAKVEELKEDNRVLQETKEVLEDQLDGWRARSDKIHQLEKQCLLLKAQVDDLEQEKIVDQKRIEELQEENLSLYMAQRRSMEESQHLGWELEQLSKTTENCQGPQSLSEEVSETTRSRMIKLEKENQSLLRTIEELRATSTSIEAVHVCHGFRTSTTEESKELQSSNIHIVNHMDSAVTQETWNGDVSYNHQPRTMAMEGVQTKIFFTESTDFYAQKKGLVENKDGSVHSEDLVSNLEVLENRHNGLHCFVEPESPSDSKSCSPSYTSIFTGLPTHSSYASKHTQRLEAKCRTLDTFNQHLQTSLDNTERKVQRLEAEVQEMEAENQSLQATLEELRISTRRMEQLETEKQSLEQENHILERERRQLEKENRRLRQQAEIQDANLDRSNISIASLEKETRFLVKELEGLRETAERVKCLERDNRELNKQRAIDQKTLATLREDLVSEKLKNQQKDNDLEMLTHELEVKYSQEKQQEALDTNRFKMLESELEVSLKKSLQIKEEKIEALEARLQESSVLNLQLRQELRTVKLSYEALQQRLDEESALSSTPPKETAMSELLRESQEATKELLKLKDRLINVERNNATLEAERHAMQAHVKQLDSQSDSQQAQVLALQRQATALQENNTALQTHNANLQVEKSTLNSQCASLLAQNTQLQQQQTRTENERDTVIREREELRTVHEQLLRDHERLAALHERQALEYEALMGKHGCIKNVHRTLELENRSLQDRYNTCLQQRRKLEDLEKTLKEEQLKIAMEKEQHKAIVAECGRLRDEKDWLNQTYRLLLNDNELLTAEHKEVKSQLNEAKLEHTWLQADFSKLKKDFQELDINYTKLNNQCELLSQLKGNLEEENRHLLNQIETLMLQNRTLLEQTMESKDLFHVEERQYIDKLNDLRRQKEKLEEKIMDQYKFYEPSPPRRRGNWITLKLRKLIKSSSRDNASEQPPSPTHQTEAHLLCHDNSSFIGSEGSSPASHAASPQRSSTSLKMFPRMKKRLKDKDKVKSIFRRSMSLSSLVHPSPLLRDDRWAASTRELDRTDTEINAEDTVTSSFATSILSIFNLHSTKALSPETTHHHPSTHNTALHVSDLWVTDKDSNDSAVPSGLEDNDELQNHVVNGTQSRAQSESSGEFSLNLENEPWSNGSSPIQQPAPHRPSSSIQPPTDTSTPQHAQLQKSSNATPKDKTSTTPKQKDQDFWLTRGTRSIRRGSKNKLTHCLSDATGTDKTNQEGSETEAASGNAVTTRVVACSPITVLYVQGKSSSMSGCLNCFTTPIGKDGKLKGNKSTKSLSRASNVIPKGSSRRLSVSSDCKIKSDSLPVQVSENNLQQDESSPKKQPEMYNNSGEPVPPVKPPRDLSVVPSDRPKSPVQESAFGSAFTFNSVFSNTIFSDSVITTTTNMTIPEIEQTFVCLNQSLVQNGQISVCNTPQTVLSGGSEKEQYAENAMEKKDHPYMTTS